MSKKLFGKFFIILLVVGLLFAAAPTKQALAQSPSVWDGTYPGTKPAGMLAPVGGVQEVWTAEEFAWLAKQTNMFQNGVVNTVKLMVDIDLNNKPWTPSIALGQGEDNGYVLDGNGKTISNLSINVYQPGTIVYAGMFVKSGDAIPMPTIRNLTIDGATVTGTSDEYMRIYAGVLSASDEWRGNFENITITDAVVTGSKYVGGIAAYATGNFINCSVTDTTLVVNEKLANATTRTIPHVGALVGLLGGGQVKGNTIDNIDIDLTPPTGYDVPETQIGALIGTAQASVLVGANSVSDVTLNDVIFTKLIGLDYRTYKVVNTTQMLGYTTIQAAIDAAAGGDVIEVGPGTYNEAVIINKPNLTIRSTAGAATTIIDVPFGTLTTGVKVLANMGVVTFDGFTVKNFTEGGIIQGMAARPGTTFHVLNNIVLPYEPLSGVPYLRNGIQVSGDGSTVKGNYVNGAYLTNDWSSTAILVVNASNVEVSGNTISGEEFGLDYGIGVANWDTGAMTNILIKNNIVDHADYSLDVTAYSGTISGVVIEYNKVTNYIEPLWAGISGGVSVSQVDASPNWWGDPLGPQGAVTGDVSYKPWCANAACTEFLPAMVTIAPVASVVCGNITTTTIDIMVAGIPASTPLQGYSFRLHFDNTKTSIANLGTDIVNGGFVANGGLFFTKWIDESGNISLEPTGIIEVIYSQTYPSTSIGNGKLASITLTHLNVAGDIALSLTDVLLSDRDGFVIPSEASATATTLTLQPSVMNTTKSLGYCDLASAVAGATAGDNIQLLADITIPATVTVDKALSLDLNGKVASYPQTDNSFVLRVDGASASLTINDTSDPDTGAIRAIDVDNAWEGRGINVLNGGSLIVNGGSIQGEYASVYVRAGSSMVLNGGTIGGVNGTIEYSGIVILGNGTPGSAALTVNGGVIDSYDFAISGNGTAGYTGTSIQINAGTITADATALYLPQDGVVNIAGGTITAPTAIEVKSGDLNVSGGTITGTGPYVATPSLVAGYSTDTGDAIFITSQTGYAGGINVNITGGTIQSTNSWAMREYYLSTQDFKVDKISVSNGTFTGGAGAVTFSSQLASGGLTDLALTGGLYNTDPAYPDVFVFVPYGTIPEGSMYRIVGISLNVDSFYYWKEGTTFLGVKADIGTTNFLFSEASLVKVELFSGTTGAYTLQQTSTLKVPANWVQDSLTSPFNIFGTYVSSSWLTVRETEYGQHVAPTRVLVTVVLPGGTLTAESTILGNGTYADIQPSILIGDAGYMDFSGVRGVSAGVVSTNFNFNMATAIEVKLYAGTTLLQTNTAPSTSPLFTSGYTSISGPFDIWGTFDYAADGNWSNARESEYGQTLVPTKVVATVTLPGDVILTAEREIDQTGRPSILPGVSGLVTLQGILAPRAGVQIFLTSGTLVRDTFSTALSEINYGFTGVETLTYTFTTSQARYLNVTTASSKIFLVDRDLNLTDLRLYGGDVDQNNEIQVNDASLVGQNWGSTTDPEANINYDGIVNIQDLALVGGNFGMTSATAYNWWSPLP